MNYLKLFFLLIFVAQTISCSSSNAQAKRKNIITSALLPFASARTKQVYNHSLINSHRQQSDCQKSCPDVDVWQYQYQVDKKIISSNKPISIQKQYWKSPHEARIIAISLFGANDFYYHALLQYLESFKHIKELNGIKDEIWGYETFTVRVYMPKRNPKFLKTLGPLTGSAADEKISKLLSLGCEIAFVDNHLSEVKKDGTFWRFMVTSDEMPQGQKIRYLLRDADNILTAVEMYTVADWIKSDKKYHRMHIMPICIGPLTAMLWGGMHTGKGEWSDFYDLVRNYPYRFEYGDDELFSRDIIWPRIKSSGSILSHHFERKKYITFLASPYTDSCEEPTQKFCLKVNPHAQCEDRVLPDVKNLQGGVEALGLRMTLKDLAKEHPEFFDLDLKRSDRKFIYDAFKSK